MGRLGKPLHHMYKGRASGPQSPSEKLSMMAHAYNSSDGEMRGRDKEDPGSLWARNPDLLGDVRDQ